MRSGCVAVSRRALSLLPDGRSIVDHHHLAARFVGFHDAMRLADLVEAEDPGRLRLETPSRHLYSNLLERHIGQRELRRAEHEAAEEREIDTAGHLQQRIEVGNRREATQPARQAGATTPAEHGEGIEDGAVADQIEYRIQLLRFRDPLRHLRPLRLDVPHLGLLPPAPASLNRRAGVAPRNALPRHGERGLAEGGGPATYDQ